MSQNFDLIIVHFQQHFFVVCLQAICAPSYQRWHHVGLSQLNEYNHIRFAETILSKSTKGSTGLAQLRWFLILGHSQCTFYTIQIHSSLQLGLFLTCVQHPCQASQNETSLIYEAHQWFLSVDFVYHQIIMSRALYY